MINPVKLYQITNLGIFLNSFNDSSKKRWFRQSQMTVI